MNGRVYQRIEARLEFRHRRCIVGGGGCGRGWLLESEASAGAVWHRRWVPARRVGDARGCGTGNECSGVQRSV